jgi:hypothetical protein
MKNKFVFFLSVIFVFLVFSGCAITPIIGPTEKIQEPSISKNAILILGLKFSGDYDFTTAAVSINVNGRIVKAIGFLLKDTAPTDSKPRPLWAVYTGGSDHGYLVFDLPVNFADKKTAQYLVYLTRIGFSGLEQEASPAYLALGAINGINKSGQRVWFQLYRHDFSGPIGLQNTHPLGYKEDSKWSFYGCKFDIENPGIYYLGELEINANLTITEFNPNGSFVSKKRVHDMKSTTSIANWSVLSYNDILAFKKYLDINNINNSSFIDYSKYWKQISQEEYLTFGK